MSRIGVKGSKNGGYGKIYLRRYRQVVHAYKHNYIPPDVDFCGSLAEATFLQYLDHPHIIKLNQIKPSHRYNVEEQMRKDDYVPDRMIMDMEFALRDGKALASNRSIKWKRKKRSVVELMLGLEYMHYKGVFHRDIKLNNILQVKSNFKPVKAKWCDFGLSSYSQFTVDAQSAYIDPYRAPEVFKGGVVTQKTESWAMAMLIIAILTRSEWSFYPTTCHDNKVDPLTVIANRLPLRCYSQSELQLLSSKVDFESKRFDWKESLPPYQRKQFDLTPGSFDQLIDLIDSMLRLDPTKRFNLTQALDHKWCDQHRQYINKVRQEYLKPKQYILKPIPETYKQSMFLLAREFYSIDTDFKPNNLIYQTGRLVALVCQAGIKYDNLVHRCAYMVLKICLPVECIPSFLDQFNFTVKDGLEFEMTVFKTLGAKLFQESPFENLPEDEAVQMVRSYLKSTKEIHTSDISSLIK